MGTRHAGNAAAQITRAPRLRQAGRPECAAGRARPPRSARVRARKDQRLRFVTPSVAMNSLGGAFGGGVRGVAPQHDPVHDRAAGSNTPRPARAAAESADSRSRSCPARSLSRYEPRRPRTRACRSARRRASVAGVAAVAVASVVLPGCVLATGAPRRVPVPGRAAGAVAECLVRAARRGKRVGEPARGLCGAPPALRARLRRRTRRHGTARVGGAWATRRTTARRNGHVDQLEALREHQADRDRSDRGDRRPARVAHAGAGGSSRAMSSSIFSRSRAGRPDRSAFPGSAAAARSRSSGGVGKRRLLVHRRALGAGRSAAGTRSRRRCGVAPRSGSSRRASTRRVPRAARSMRGLRAGPPAARRDSASFRGRAGDHAGVGSAAGSAHVWRDRAPRPRPGGNASSPSGTSAGCRARCESRSRASRPARAPGSRWGRPRCTR